MAQDIKAPSFPESIADGTIANWLKKSGEQVKRDEMLVEIETDKVMLEVVAPCDGVLTIVKNEGDTVVSNEVIGSVTEGAVATAAISAVVAPTVKTEKNNEAESKADEDLILAPAARKLAEENDIDPTIIKGTGKGGRIRKEDVVAIIEAKKLTAGTTPANASSTKASTSEVLQTIQDDRVEKRVPMTRLRAKVAERLLDAQSSMAMLTTFNEVNMKPIMDLRTKYKDLFEKKHDGVRLGFMSFFVKAATEALKRFPAVNASIDGNDVVYHGYQDIGVAVSSDRGLVVPILRNAEFMSLAEIEAGIKDFGNKAKTGKLTIEEMTGGTFTISNGGVFGSLLSTPIVNPPQTAILGMHKIQERPMAVKGEIVILPMMYLALSYDHRMIDGKEAVSFLVTMKDFLEDPARLLLDV